VHSDLKHFLILMAIIFAVIFIASFGLVFESLNGMAWLLATPVVVGVFFIYRHIMKRLN